MGGVVVPKGIPLPAGGIVAGAGVPVPGAAGASVPGAGSRLGGVVAWSPPPGIVVAGVAMGCCKGGGYPWPGTPIEPVAGGGTVVRPQKGSMACWPVCWHPLKPTAATSASTRRVRVRVLAAIEVAVPSCKERERALAAMRRLTIFSILSRRIFHLLGRNYTTILARRNEDVDFAAAVSDNKLPILPIPAFP